MAQGLINDAVKRIAPFIELARKHHGEEIECRLVYKDDKYKRQSHIPQACFIEIHDYLCQNAVSPSDAKAKDVETLVAATPDFVHSRDYFYSDERIRNSERNKHLFLTRTSLLQQVAQNSKEPSKKAKVNSEMQRVWIYKKKIINLPYDIPEKPLDFTISYKTEEPFPESEPKPNEVTLVRVKTTKVFFVDYCKITLSAVWTGRNSVDLKDNKDKPLYEIEVELDLEDPSTKKVDSTHLAACLLLTTLKLVGLEGISIRFDSNSFAKS